MHLRAKHRVAASIITAWALAVLDEPARAQQAASTEHPFFSTVSIEDIDSVVVPSDGDLWVSCWSDDDAVYTANGDGKGFGTRSDDIVMNRVEGRPNDPADPLRGTTLALGQQVGPNWIGAGIFYNRKPTGMLCVNGELYAAVQDCTTYTFDESPNGTITRSTDKGRSFTWDMRAPMFSDRVFTTIMFLDYGKDSEHAPDDFVYAYGLDDNWSSVYSKRPPQTKLYLARVPKTQVQDRASWEFFTGRAADGTPSWSADIAQRAAVLEDTSRRYADPLDPNLERQNMTTLNEGSIVYNAPLKRYIYSTWTQPTFELYEAPAPWGPWTHFYTKDFGVFPWTDAVAGGYATIIPSKFISADGQTMWMHSNVWEAEVNHYKYSLRKVQVTPWQASEPNNAPSPDNLASAVSGAVAFVRVARHGHSAYLNDGVSTGQSEESWSGERKTEDFWGYTFSRAVRVNKVRYTTGEVASRGGWFENLTVQVRQGKDWVAVSATVSPAYAADASVLGHKTYTFSFDAVDTDGVRVFGKPGGADAFTNIAELSVHYE